MLSVNYFGRENRNELQKLIDTQQTVHITEKGEYCIQGTLYLHDGTHLIFDEGVVFKRIPEEVNGYFMINDGAFSGKINKSITVEGLTLSVNGVESLAGTCVPTLNTLKENGTHEIVKHQDKVILGLRGQASFMYVKDLTVKNYTLLDLADWDYGIQISDFENVLLENIHIEGNKDGVHFGPGNGFVLRNGIFRTKDDPIALNSDDYSPSAPTVGELTNGLIENCIDLNQDATYGYFIRFHMGAFAPWQKGMDIMHSDTVIYENKMYRAVLPPDGSKLISLTPPTHVRGYAIVDGIPWLRTNIGYSELPTSAGISNITLRGLTMQKKRDVGVLMYYSDNRYHRGVRSGIKPPVAQNIRFESFKLEEAIDTSFLICVPTEKLVIADSDLAGTKIKFEQPSCRCGAQSASFALENVRNFVLADSSAFTGNAVDYEVKY